MKSIYQSTIIFLTGFLLLSGISGHAAKMELIAAKGSMAEDAPGLRVGDRAPEINAISHDGKPVQLSALTAEGPVVLIFYRGAWCAYCNLHLQSFQQRIDEFNAAGAQILAISIDKPEYSAKTVSENTLGFDVISDPGADILTGYGLIFQVPNDLAKTYKEKYGIDLEAHSGRTDHVIAVPATYIVNQEGIVTFAYADVDYKVRATPDQVLEALHPDTGITGL